jgi:Fe-S-cluster-containing dehydrogenase component
MNNDRRKFLKQTGWTLLGSGLFVSLGSFLPSLCKASQRQGAALSRELYGFIVDATTCIGCGKCVQACKQENHVPDECYRTWIERYIITADDNVYVDSPHGGMKGFEPKQVPGNIEKAFFVPKLCNHCAEANCVQVCPVGATYKTREGVVLVDEKQCVGCGYCVQACPYGARFINPDRHTADKCTWCYHRIKQELMPACVLVCPVGARLFGNMRDPNSTVSRILREERINVLKPETGNSPKTFYVGLDKEVR